MLELIGKYSVAKVFTDTIEQEAAQQIIELLNQEFVNDSIVRIMPDTHAGKGCTIGTTMTLKDKVVPNLVGVDIGCGMLTVQLEDTELDLPSIDTFIREKIPSGFNINQNPQTDYKKEIENLRSFRELSKSSREFNRALGSLGGGNHFIEINQDVNCKYYLVIHSGSRNLGNQVALYYQKRAYDYHRGLNDTFIAEKNKLIISYKEQGRRKEIQKAIKNLTKEYIIESEISIPKDLCYLEGQLMQDYLHDMNIVQKYAEINREVMARRIVNEVIGIDYDSLEKFQTIHNYIELENNILRKGAISAKKDEKVLIPINMRDGSIIAIGKGNPDWNYSAPHGAGRLMSRTKAKQVLNISDFEASMEGIYTTSVNQQTLDEAPMAYKPIDEIISNIQDTVDILDIIKPVYNFKA